MKYHFLMIAVMIFSICCHGADVKLPPKEKFYLVLLAGQSNMAGRGKVTEKDKIPHPRVLMLNKKLKWVPAVDPVHFDKRTAGVGLARRFAQRLAESDPTITVGLIPSACGGSPISVWQPGVRFKPVNGYPYDDAIARARHAMKDGTLKVILWHQGESDANKKRAKFYEENLDELVKRFREDLNAPQVPFIAGQLSKFPGKKWNKSRKMVDKATRKVVADNQPAAFVLSDGLTSNPDFIHFDRASLIKFGERYFKAYQKLMKEKSK